LYTVASMGMELLALPRKRTIKHKQITSDLSAVVGVVMLLFISFK